MNLKNMPVYERPREKAIQNGVSSLSDSELIAILLRCGNRQVSVIELANQLLVEFGGLDNLLNSNITSIMKIKGINQVKALDLKVCYELANRLNKYQHYKQKKAILSAKDVYNRYHLLTKQLNQEIFYVLYLNVKLQILQEEKLFVGGSDASYIDLKILFKKALLCNATKIICFHNHPSGEVLPSETDIFLTENIKNMGAFLNINLVDHIILGVNTYYSIIERKQYFVETDTK